MFALKFMVLTLVLVNDLELGVNNLTQTFFDLKGLRFEVVDRSLVLGEAISLLDET